MSARPPWESKCPPEYADCAMLYDAIVAAPGDALPAIEAALRARRHKALDPQARRHLLAEAARLPVRRCVEFVEANDDDGTVYGPILALTPGNHVRVLIAEGASEAFAKNTLLHVVALITEGALRECDWSDAYKRAGTSLDEAPY